MAISVVRGVDPRFAEIGILDLPISGPEMLRESWIAAIPTVASSLQSTPAAGWFDPGRGRVVEVMIVGGCGAPDGRTDPCATRHWWLYWVTDGGTVVLLAEALSPDSL